MLFKFGRFCQILGLIILPIAIAGNLHDERSMTLWRSLGVSLVGIVIFTAGWLIQQWSRPTS
jgi:hypothetical protein